MSVIENCKKSLPNYSLARIEGNIEYRTASGKDATFFKTVGWRILNLRKIKKRLVKER